MQCLRDQTAGSAGHGQRPAAIAPTDDVQATELNAGRRPVSVIDHLRANLGAESEMVCSHGGGRHEPKVLLPRHHRIRRRTGLSQQGMGMWLIVQAAGDTSDCVAETPGALVD